MLKILQILDYNTFGEKLIEIAIKTAPFVDIFWLRIKNKPFRKCYEIAGQLIKFIEREKIIVSEYPDIADILGLRGVHLNHLSLLADTVKKTFPDLTVGYSAHSIEEIKSVPADYFTLSPIFLTKKEFKITPLGLNFTLPKQKKVYALGGINKQNIHLIVNKGFYGVAGISFYKQLPDIYKILNKNTGE
ncbi:thiamine phosphate synthase [Deferribacter thermophilus]|uniref:thiamine phosphate synthase n=1 Tax=Deferribacter thermophilus TaxID=53573 RepID=UPI003C2A7A74